MNQKISLVKNICREKNMTNKIDFIYGDIFSKNTIYVINYLKKTN